MLKTLRFFVNFQTRTGCRRWSSSGTNEASAPPSPSATQPRICPSSTWCTTSNETATLTTLSLVKILNGSFTLCSWAVTIAFSNEQCTCSQPCLLLLFLRAQCERDLRSYGPFTPVIYNGWTIAWTEITKRGYRTHSLKSSISVECKPPTCREYGLHKIWRDVNILLWPWYDLHLDVWSWPYQWPIATYRRLMC